MLDTAATIPFLRHDLADTGVITDDAKIVGWRTEDHVDMVAAVRHVSRRARVARGFNCLLVKDELHALWTFLVVIFTECTDLVLIHDEYQRESRLSTLT